MRQPVLRKRYPDLQTARLSHCETRPHAPHITYGPGSIDVFSVLRKAHSYPVESALIMHDRFDVFLPALDVIRFKYGMNLDHLIAKDQQHFQSDMD